MKQRILIIDDEPGVRRSLALALQMQYDVHETGDPEEGLELVQQERIHLCLLDLRIKKVSGIDVLRELKRIDSRIAVIIITAYGSIHSSVMAMKGGAYSYLTKPVELDELNILIEQALAFQQLNEKVAYLSSELETRHGMQEIVGKSKPMQQVYEQIDRLRDVDTSVVITGESGTGKELAARAIHFSGKRKDGRFVEVNCAAIPDQLLEEELFGYKRGAFTGAVANKEGMFEYADNGTIFLDEIGDMPLALQAKLLRVLEQKEFVPIGGNHKVKVDVRVIAATNRDLQQMVQEGSFRKDLFFRLNVINIVMPALRDKKQDLPLLIAHFINRFNNELGKNVRGVSEAAGRMLMAYSYPGNVRELSNILEYAMVFSDQEYLQTGDLPAEIRAHAALDKNLIVPRLGDLDSVAEKRLTGRTLAEIEKSVIAANLRQNGGSIKATAAVLGLSDKGLRNKIQAYDIDWRPEGS